MALSDRRIDESESTEENGLARRVCLLCSMSNRNFDADWDDVFYRTMKGS